MTIAGFEAEISVPGSQSLKDKRMAVKSVLERVKRRYNVSAVECGHQDKWQLAKLGFAIASISQTAARDQLERIIDFLYQDERIEVIKIDKF